jgi:hypothetical protein
MVDMTTLLHPRISKGQWWLQRTCWQVQYLNILPTKYIQNFCYSYDTQHNFLKYLFVYCVIKRRCKYFTSWFEVLYRHLPGEAEACVSAEIRTEYMANMSPECYPYAIQLGLFHYPSSFIQFK